MTEKDTLGLRELTDAEMGFLRVTRNYAGAIILAFIKINKDAVALDCHDGNEASLNARRVKVLVNRAGLQRYIQTYVQGKVMFISRPPGAEQLILSKDQEEKIS